MKVRVQTWFSNLRTAATTPGAYWRTLPLRSMRKLLAAAFITLCGIDFVIDLFLLNYQPLAARGKVRRRTEAGDAPGWQGATSENIGNI